MKSVVGAQQISDARLWTIWIVVTIAVAIGQALTLSRSPTVFQDEVQIVETGRLFLDGSRHGSLFYYPDGISILGLSHIGTLTHELLLRLAGYAFVAPRLFELCVAMVGAGVLLAWLRRRGVSAGVAMVISWATAFDPSFERSYRGGRLEALVFLVAWIACWLVAALPDRSPATRRRDLFVVGLLTGLLPWIYPSAVMLIPLVALELWHVSARDDVRSGQHPRRQMFMMVAAGASVSTIACLLPILPVLWPVVRSAWGLQLYGFRVGNAAAIEGPLWLSILTVVRYSPVLPVLALMNGWRRGQRATLTVTLMLLVGLLASRFYLYRYLYLLPYFAVLAADACEQWRRQCDARAPRWRAWWPQGVALGWAIALSIGVRSWVTVQEWPYRDYATVRRASERAIGRGPRQVCLATEALELYYAGRQLGWELTRAAEDLPDQDFDSMLNRCEYYLLREPDNTPDFHARMAVAGFHQTDTLETTPPVPVPLTAARYGGAPYIPLIVYRRTKSVAF